MRAERGFWSVSFSGVFALDFGFVFLFELYAPVLRSVAHFFMCFISSCFAKPGVRTLYLTYCQHLVVSRNLRRDKNFQKRFVGSGDTFLCRLLVCFCVEGGQRI